MLLQHCHRASESSKAQAEHSPAGSKAKNFKNLNTCNHIQIEFASSGKDLVLKASIKTEPNRMAVSPHLSFCSAILLCHSYCWLLYVTGKKKKRP